MAGPRYRHPEVDDVQAIVKVINESNRDNPLWEIYNPEEFRRTTFENEEWNRKGHWLALQRNQAVGYGGGRVVESMSGRDSWVVLWVPSSHRKKGIEQELMRKSIEYVRNENAERVKCFDLEGTEWRDAVRREYGFEVIHRMYFMSKEDRQLPEVVRPEKAEVEEFDLKEATDDDLGILRAVLNEVFSTDPNFVPYSMNSLRRWRDSSPNLVRVFFARVNGDVIGICVPEIEVEYNKTHDTEIGWIRHLGVVEEHRRKGVGRTLLVDGLRWILDTGMKTLWIGLDEGNPPAENLYRSIGFEVREEGIISCLEL